MVENFITTKFKLTSNEQVSVESSDTPSSIVDSMF